MGAEREDTDPHPQRGGAPAAAADTLEEEPAPVDFDALHAALGDPLDYEEMPSGPALEKGVTGEADDLLDGLEASLAAGQGGGGKALLVGESSGRSSATYASARPRTIPPTRAPVEDPNAPAVIVATDDTVPTAPPQMTVPLAPAQGHAAPAFGGGAPHATPPMHGHPPAGNPGLAKAPGAHPGMPPGSARAGHPGSGPHANAAANAPGAPSYGQTPMPFPVQARPVAQMTMRMPDRPVNPRRGKTATVVVRPRGPSAKQKLVAFMAMLLLVTACGIAVIIWRKPRWLGLEMLGGSPSTTTAATVTTPPGTATQAATSTGTAAATTPTAATTQAAALGAATSGATTASTSSTASTSGTSSTAAGAGASTASAPVKKVLKPLPTPAATATAAPHPSALR